MITEDDIELRERAVTQLRKKHDFHAHLLAYVCVNAFLVAIWAVTDPGGFFWPIFPIFGWGIGVCFNAWDVVQRTTDRPADPPRDGQTRPPRHIAATSPDGAREG